jgi:hypothetical protein
LGHSGAAADTIARKRKNSWQQDKTAVPIKMAETVFEMNRTNAKFDRPKEMDVPIKI